MEDGIHAEIHKLPAITHSLDFGIIVTAPIYLEFTLKFSYQEYWMQTAESAKSWIIARIYEETLRTYNQFVTEDAPIMEMLEDPERFKPQSKVCLKRINW